VLWLFKMDEQKQKASIVFDCLVENIDYEDDVERRALFLGIPLIVHEVVETDQELFQVCAEYMRRMDVSAIHKFHLLEFFTAWCTKGRPLATALLKEMELLVRDMADTPARSKCLETVEKSLDSFSPVLGRWKANLSPRSNLLAWLDWDAEAIAVALTAMCLPFYRLRSDEFDEKTPGKHLKDLNMRYNSVTKFVTASVLAAAVISKKLGIQAVEKWLETAKELHERRNYHMLFAIQNGLQKHQVDRLDLIWHAMSKKHFKIKAKIDALFSAADRMAPLLAELADNVGKHPMIPCIFWLVQKATLLKETPVLGADGRLNADRVVAATNIFRDMMIMQEQRYPPLREDEQVLWYLMRLEREGKDASLSEDELYKLSDAAKKHNSRSRANSFTFRPVKAKKRSSMHSMDPNKRGSSSQHSVPTLQLPGDGPPSPEGALSLQDVLLMSEELLDEEHGSKESSPNKSSRVPKLSPRFYKKGSV